MSEQEVVDLVKQVEAAELNLDASALEGLLASEFSAIGPRAFVLDKAQWLERYTSGQLQNTKFELVDPQVRTYGDTAVVTAIQDQEGTYAGHDAGGKFRSSIVATKRDGHWQVVHFQISGPIMAPPGPPPS